MNRCSTLLAFAFALVMPMGVTLSAQVQGGADAETLPAFAEFVAALSPQAQKTPPLCVVFDVTGQLVGSDAPPRKRHHVVSFSPDLREYRYDHIDHRGPGNELYLLSKFRCGEKMAFWNGVVAPELLPEMLRGVAAVPPHGGFCYQGPNSGSSPDMIFHILGRSIAGTPIVDWVKAASPTHAQLTRPSAAQPYFTFRNERFVLEIEPNGALKYLVRYTVMGKDTAPEIYEELRVLSTAKLGPVTLPTVIIRRQTMQEGLLQERYELRREGTREISQAELDEATNPLLPAGVQVVDDEQVNPNPTLLKEPRRVFVQGAGK